VCLYTFFLNKPHNSPQLIRKSPLGPKLFFRVSNVSIINRYSKGCGLNTVSALWIKTQITVDQCGSAWLVFFLEVVGWVCLGFRIGSV
jgi:hypothetical protein